MHPLHGVHRRVPCWRALAEVPIESDPPCTNVRYGAGGGRDDPHAEPTETRRKPYDTCEIRARDRLLPRTLSMVILSRLIIASFNLFVRSILELKTGSKRLESQWTSRQSTGRAEIAYLPHASFRYLLGNPFELMSTTEQYSSLSLQSIVSPDGAVSPAPA